MDSRLPKNIIVYTLKGHKVTLSFYCYMWTISLARNNIEFVQTIKEWLFLNFEMKDTSETSYILGVKIYRDRSRKLLALSESLILKEFLKILK